MTTIRALEHKMYTDNWNLAPLELPFEPETVIVYSNPQRIGDIIINSGMYLGLRSRFSHAKIYQLERDLYPTHELWDTHPAKIERFPFVDFCFKPKTDIIWQTQNKSAPNKYKHLQINRRTTLLIDLVRKLLCSLLVSYKIRARYRYSLLPKYPLLAGHSCTQQGFKRNLGHCSMWQLSQAVVYPLTQTLLPANLKWSETTYSARIESWKSQSIGASREFIVLCPTAGNPSKLWDYSQWRVVVEYVLKLGLTPVVLVPRSEQPMIEPEFRSLAEVVFFPGSSIEFDDPTASLELMRRARMTIGVDSGGVHLAAAAGCSVLVLTHPKNYVQWLPITERGRAVVSDVLELSNSHPTWLTGIKAEDVCQAIDQILSGC